MEKSGSRWKDSLGIAASALCAVHCAATPILLAFLPTLQFTEWMASPQFHQIAAVICVALVSVSIWPAFRKFKDYRVLGLSSTGLSMILAAAFLLPDTCCTSGCCSTEESATISADTHDHSGHDHSGHDHVLLASSKISADHDHAGHDHSGHDHSGHAHTDSDAAASTESTSSFQLASSLFGSLSLGLIQPWLTPIGGVLLICAHFLNMRRALSKCSADCKCPNASNDENLLESPAAQAA